MSAILDTPESDLWIAVINQALYDATLGLSLFKQGGKGRQNPTRVTTGSNLSALDVMQARGFISGKTCALKDICEALGMDFETTHQNLIAAYRECMPRMPEEWRQPL